MKSRQRFCVGFQGKALPTWNTEATMWIYTLNFVSFDWFASNLLVPRDFFYCISTNQIARIGVWFPWRLGAWHISCFRFDNIYHPRTAHADKNFSREFRFWLAKFSPRQKPWISSSFLKLLKSSKNGMKVSFARFPAKNSWHMLFSRPANILFPPQTTAKKQSQASVKRDRKPTKRSPSYR